MAKNPAQKSDSAEAGRALASLLFTIVIPTIVLSKFSGDASLGVKKAVLIAFAFPLGFGIYEYVRSKKIDFLAVLGLLNVLMTGGLALLGSDWKWIAIKEASFALLLAGFVIVSQKMGKPFIKTMFLNPAMVDAQGIEKQIEQKELQQPFHALLNKCSVWLALAFTVSAVLNFLIAWWLLHDKTPNSEAFNGALGTMNWSGFLVIGIPLAAALMVIMFKVFYPSLARMLGVEPDDLLNPGQTVRRTVAVKPPAAPVNPPDSSDP